MSSPVIRGDQDGTSRVALVTGGASGIGEAIVTAFEDAGVRVVVLDRDVSGARASAPEGRVLVEADITDPVSVQAAVDEAVAATGHLDVLVNCAGTATIAPAMDIDLAGWESTIRVNLTGSFIVSRTVAKHLAARGGGRIVNICSQAATVALAGHVAYAASKAGMLGMTRTLALEWGPLGITVNCVSPTVVLTPLSRPNWENPAGEALREQIPTGRFAEPEEVASAVLYLASPAAGMVNGHDLLVDGGYTVR